MIIFGILFTGPNNVVPYQKRQISEMVLSYLTPTVSLLLSNGQYFPSVQSGPNGYPIPARYPALFSIPDLTRFSFKYHQVLSIPFLPEITDIYGKTKENEVPGNTWSNILTLLPGPNPAATQLFFLLIPDMNPPGIWRKKNHAWAHYSVDCLGHKEFKNIA